MTTDTQDPINLGELSPDEQLLIASLRAGNLADAHHPHARLRNAWRPGKWTTERTIAAFILGALAVEDFLSDFIFDSGSCDEYQRALDTVADALSEGLERACIGGDLEQIRHDVDVGRTYEGGLRREERHGAE